MKSRIEGGNLSKPVNFQRFIIIILIIIIVTITATISYLLVPAEKTGIVQIKTIYNDFEFKKELELELKSITNQKQKHLDSLKLKINILERQIELQGKPDEKKIHNYNLLIDEFEIMTSKYEEEQEIMSTSYNQQILNQINQFVKDYALKNNYKIIYGTDNNGYIMYANESMDITKSVIKYINMRYAGEK